jgi:hypothetical protein
MSTYVIAKVSRNKWELRHSQPGWIGTHIGFYPSSKKAEVTARVLAGRTGKVVIQ